MINKIREIEFINKISDLYFKKANNKGTVIQVFYDSVDYTIKNNPTSLCVFTIWL